MASPATKNFTDATFDAEVLKADHPVLVDFWAEWCMPCKMLAPTIDRLATEFAGKASVGKMDTDANRNTAIKYGITAIPTVLIFQGGEVRKKFVGMTSADALSGAINELLKA